MADNDEESKEKNYYTEYRDYCVDLSDTEKKISEQLTLYKQKMKDGGLTIELENKIKSLLQHYKTTQNSLNDAYTGINIPSGYPQKELDKRQKEIQQFGFNYEKMLKEYNSYENERYKFKDEINEDYTQKEEFKYMSRGELMALEKKKLNNQNEQLESITLDVKKNTELAKHTKHVLKEQNKKMEQINEDMERTQEKMDKVTDRFKNYATNMSWCKLIFIMISEFGLALVAYILLID